MFIVVHIPEMTILWPIAIIGHSGHSGHWSLVIGHWSLVILVIRVHIPKITPFDHWSLHLGRHLRNKPSNRHQKWRNVRSQGTLPDYIWIIPRVPWTSRGKSHTHSLASRTNPEQDKGEGAQTSKSPRSIHRWCRMGSNFTGELMFNMKTRPT